MELEFERADLRRDRDVLVRLNVEYLDWIADAVQTRYALSLSDLLGESIPAYVEKALDKLCEGEPPDGIFYVVSSAGTAIGMGGLRRLDHEVGEIKRMYVARSARGGGVGARILDRLIDDARGFGFERLLLDTGPFMTSAHRLYEAAGFVDDVPYPEAEVPESLRHDWRFMRRELES